MKSKNILWCMLFIFLSAVVLGLMSPMFGSYAGAVIGLCAAIVQIDMILGFAYYFYNKNYINIKKQIKGDKDGI